MTSFLGSLWSTPSLPYTLLSLSRFARIMQVNPVHFMGANASVLWPHFGCDSVWPQYTYQTREEVASRQYISHLILQAEDEIRRILGFSVAPAFFEEEEHGHFSGRWNGLIHTHSSKIIGPGRRATHMSAEGVDVVYSDLDGDGFKETATVTAIVGDISPSEVHLFHAGYSREKEIRPLRSVSISDAGVATILADSWLFINPDLYELTPGEYQAVDLSTVDNLVNTVDVIRVYRDTSQPAVQLIWSRSGACGYCYGAGCESCTETVQDGCFSVVDGNLIKIYPASYADNVWTTASPTYHRSPDRVKLWYEAGDREPNSLEQMPERWAQAVCHLAAARLELPVCECTNVRNVFNRMKVELSESKPNSFAFRNLEGDLFTNPFGTRFGEYRAWQMVALIPEYAVAGGTL